MIIFDLPYNLLDLTWDVAITRAFMDNFLKQVIAINNCENYVVVLYHTMSMTSMLYDALSDAHFQHMTPFFWHKTDHLTQTPMSSYTQSVECGTIAFKGSRDKNAFNMSRDPRQRHNFIDTPSVTTYRRDDNKEVINPCQKPPALAKWLVSNHCQPGSTVLVCGAGALGEVEGAVEAGCHVVAVEADKHQFEQSGAHLVKMAEEDAKRNEPEDVNEEKSPTTSKKGKVEKKKATKQTKEATEEKPAEDTTPPNCIDCGNQLPPGYDKSIVCVVCNDGAPMHYACAQKGTNDQWFCTDHLTASLLDIGSPSQGVDSQ